MNAVLKLRALTILLSASLGFATVFAQAAAPSRKVAMAAPPKADTLAAGAEIFENLTEAAPSLKAGEFKKALSDFDLLYPKISTLLSPDRKLRLDGFMTGLRNGWQTGDRRAMAIQSIEAYRLLEESIGTGGRAVPVEVSLLDYAGFKLNALMLGARPDWKQAATTAQEARSWWVAIGPRISDPTLKNAMARTIEGLQHAAARKDPELLRFAANMDLILVDGLETLF